MILFEMVTDSFIHTFSKEIRMKNIKRMAALVMAASMITSFAAYAEGDIGIAPGGGGTYSYSIGPSSYISNSDMGIGPGGNSSTAQTGTNTASNSYNYTNPGASTATAGNSVTNPTNINGTVDTNVQTSAVAQSTTQVNIQANVAAPEIKSTAACLYDATTGQVLFDKECNKAMYPASTTKLMTALIAVEQLSLTDTVTFSASATQNLESGASNVQMTTGDTMSVEDCLYALLLGSACEVANGLAEKVSGSQAAFAELMNEKAKTLGCANTHFANASGLNSTEHYTTAFDMCLITKAALDNETIRKVVGTISYKLPATAHRGTLTVTNGNKMINSSNSQYYNGIIGGKTGYTSKAGNTLATAANVSGHELVAVVLKSTQSHYDDTKALYNYGKQLIAASGAAISTSAGTTSSTASAGTSASASAASTTAAASAMGGSWAQDGSKWKYLKSNGSYATSEWLDINGKTYFFGSDSYMCTGWKQFSNGSWYYFDTENGTMVAGKWVNYNGKSYYMNADGTMAKNTVINNTYKVDENGVYIGKVG